MYGRRREEADDRESRRVMEIERTEREEMERYRSKRDERKWKDEGKRLQLEWERNDKTWIRNREWDEGERARYRNNEGAPHHFHHPGNSHVTTRPFQSAPRKNIYKDKTTWTRGGKLLPKDFMKENRSFRDTREDDIHGNIKFETSNETRINDLERKMNKLTRIVGEAVDKLIGNSKTNCSTETTYEEHAQNFLTQKVNEAHGLYMYWQTGWIPVPKEGIAQGEPLRQYQRGERIGQWVFDPTE